MDQSAEPSLGAGSRQIAWFRRSALLSALRDADWQVIELGWCIQVECGCKATHVMWFSLEHRERYVAAKLRRCRCAYELIDQYQSKDASP